MVSSSFPTSSMIPPASGATSVPTDGKFHQTPPARARVEVGDTGVAIFGGILRPSDYNTEWQIPNRYTIIDQMQNDPTIEAALRAVKLPLMRARYYVEPASDSPLHKEQAEWLEYQLFEYMYGSFGDFRRHALMALDYGSYPHEIVLRLQDGRSRPRPVGPRICLAKLGPRHPRSIFEWHLNESSELDFIRQIRSSDSPGVYADIAADKLLVFINEMHGADYTGRSILRAVYKPWWYKQGMEAVDAVAKEKRASGVDVMSLSETAGDDDKALAEAALMTIRTHQQNFMTIPSDRMEYSIEGIGAGSVLSTMETMEYHDLRILRTFFAEFLAMGPSGSGGLTQHEDKTKFLLMLIEAIAADVFLEPVNCNLIPKLVQYNWGPQEEYPKLKHGKIDVRDLGALADGLYKLNQAGFLHPRADGEDEAFIRHMYDMPEPGEWLETMPAPALPGVPGQGNTEDGEPIGVDPTKPRPGQTPRPNPAATPSNGPVQRVRSYDYDGSAEPPDYMSRVVERQLATLRSLAARQADVNSVVALSVPFKSEASTLIAEHNGWTDPEQLVQARTLADMYAGTIKARVVREWTTKR